MSRRKGWHKRGFAIQFNWVFVLIGGAIILGFFISLITNHTSEEERKTAQEATQELDSLLKVSLAAGSSQKTIFFDKKIVFYCSEISEYSVEDAPNPARYDYNAIFSPPELESDELIVQTRLFEAPFRMMPVVYVTNQDVEYVFIGPSLLISSLYTEMPDNSTAALIDLKQNPGALKTYPDNDFDRVVFVLDARNESFLQKLDYFSELDWNKVFAVVINASEGRAQDFGTIGFYTYNPVQEPLLGFALNGSLPFMSSELALGAVISNDKTIYGCTLKKILQRLVLLSQLHAERMAYYASESPSYCRVHYADPASGAQKYLHDIQSYANNSLGAPSPDDFRHIFSSINFLRSLNRYILTKTDGCPLIY
jgi:hypothetical protein